MLSFKTLLKLIKLKNLLLMNLKEKSNPWRQSWIHSSMTSPRRTAVAQLNFRSSPASPGPVSLRRMSIDWLLLLRNQYGNNKDVRPQQVTLRKTWPAEVQMQLVGCAGAQCRGRPSWRLYVAWRGQERGNEPRQQPGVASAAAVWSTCDTVSKLACTTTCCTHLYRHVGGSRV